MTEAPIGENQNQTKLWITWWLYFTGSFFLLCSQSTCIALIQKKSFGYSSIALHELHLWENMLIKAHWYSELAGPTWAPPIVDSVNYTEARELNTALARESPLIPITSILFTVLHPKVDFIVLSRGPKY